MPCAYGPISFSALPVGELWGVFEVRGGLGTETDMRNYISSGPKIRAGAGWGGVGTGRVDVHLHKMPL